MNTQPACGIAPGLPNQTCRYGVLLSDQWAELHDLLTLALDALGDQPEDFNPDFLHNAMMHQREALKITHKAARRMGEAV